MATPAPSKASSVAKAVTQILLPKKKANAAGTAFTDTFNPTSTNTVLALPSFRDHLTDIFTSRTTNDARALMKDLVKFDSDVSASLHAYLTVANTQPRFYVYDINGQLDPNGQELIEPLLASLFRRLDYTQGFDFTKSIREVAEDCRYMILLNGAVATELVFNKLLQPAEIRQVDATTLEWFETAPAVYKPQQRSPSSGDVISLDIPTFFVKFYRQNPTEVYAQSIFVSAINTIAARQQVINDLYRIMQKTGYPRLEITVVEEVLRKSLPADVKTSEVATTSWINARMAEIGNAVTNLRPDSAFVHTDSVTSKMLNEKGPGSSMNVTDIIAVLNSQNQAALKTMATLIGRGEAGVNTGTVEARVFSLAADSLNGPIADLFSDMMSLALQLTGYQGYVTCEFDKVELRPETELEAQLSLRQARLLENLSLGIITDIEYHMEMFRRPPPSGAPQLSGTNFLTAGSAVQAGSVTPNSDPMGRSVSSANDKSAKSNANSSKPAKK